MWDIAINFTPSSHLALLARTLTDAELLISAALTHFVVADAARLDFEAISVGKGSC
jgi:hypothetical protein